MTDAEVFQFSDVMRGLQRVFPKRLDEHEQQQLQREYFKALRPFPLGRVAAGAEAWVQRGKFFPKPAEWIDAMPSQRQAVSDVAVMSESDARDYHRAEQMRYEDTPCRCHECAFAHVSDKPLRFVPDVSADGSDLKVHDPIRDRIVTAGHWVHGHELARWYQARADLYNRYFEIFGKLPEGLDGR